MAHLRKHSRPLPNPDNPWAIDVLQRSAIAELLTPIIESVTQPFVVTVEAPFGTGKSTFLACWAIALQQRQHTVIRFNAWETDYSQDPMAAFLICLRRSMPKTAEVATDRVFNLARKIMRALAVKAPGIVVKGALTRAIGEAGATELLATVGVSKEDIATVAEMAVSEALEAQEAAENAREQFKVALESLVAATAKTESAKLIVFVDDLDRCRPTYAIELLESIKHFFSVSGVVFVLALDWSAIESAAKAAFGDALDAGAYLRKFIDWRYRLPEPSAVLFARYLCQQYQLADLLDGKKEANSDDVATAFGEMASYLKLSLRDQVHCFTELNLALRSALPNNKRFPLETAFLTVLRFKHRDVLKELLGPPVSCDNAAERIRQLTPNLSHFHGADNYMAFLCFLFMREEDAIRFQGLGMGGVANSQHQIWHDSVRYFQEHASSIPDRQLRSLAHMLLQRIECIGSARPG
jgi:hypothetical protein